MSEKNQEWKYNSITIQDNGEYRVIDLVRTSFKPGCHIKKISKNEYITGDYDKNGVFWSDGVVYQTKKEQGMRNRRSLRQIFRTLRQLITTNFKGGESELFVTLTYAEQHNDPKKIDYDLDLFWRHLKRLYPNLKHISIVEPHASGNFHVHMLLADTAGAPLYIPDAEMRKIWGHGITSTERLDNVDNLGAYFIAYFTNMELSPDEIKVYEAQDDVEIKNGKAYIKGKRLDFYPENMRIYRHSKNCDKPVKRENLEIGDTLDRADCKFAHTTTFRHDGQDYSIHTAQYRTREGASFDAPERSEN